MLSAAPCVVIGDRPLLECAVNLSTQSLLILFSMFGAGFGVVVSASLLTVPAPRISVRWMGVVLLCISAAMMCISMDHAGYLMDSPIAFIEYLCGVMYGPLIHMYVLAVTGRRRTAAFWIVAAAAGVVVMMMKSIEALMMLQITFTALSVSTFIRGSSRCHGDDVYWTKRLLAGAVVLHAAQIIRLAVGSSISPLREIVPMTASMIFIGFCFLVLRRTFGMRLEPAAAKYARSELPESAAADHLARLERSMSTERLYRRSDLTLSTLAAELGLTSHVLSQLLNQYAGQTFTEYMNSLRVRDVQQRLADPANNRYTIEAIGQEAGFKSRSAFYAAFRKVAGMSPTEFRARTCPIRSDRTDPQ